MSWRFFFGLLFAGVLLSHGRVAAFFDLPAVAPIHQFQPPFTKADREHVESVLAQELRVSDQRHALIASCSLATPEQRTALEQHGAIMLYLLSKDSAELPFRAAAIRVESGQQPNLFEVHSFTRSSPDVPGDAEPRLYRQHGFFWLPLRQSGEAVRVRLTLASGDVLEAEVCAGEEFRAPAKELGRNPKQRFLADAFPAFQFFPTRVRVSGGVARKVLLQQVDPKYPPKAREAGIQGAVVLKVIIDRGGNVAALEVVSGHPMLVDSALEAVRQWKYRPYLLNNEPVEVETQITVNFRLR